MNTVLNLMPWRAARRQRRWRHSLLALVISVLAGGVLWWRLDMAAEARLHAQRQHNQVLAQQLSELDTQIEAFERQQQQQRAHAIARARLEHERLHFIELLDALARQTPAGVILTDIQQQGDTLSLTARTANSTQMARTVQQWGAAAAGTPVLSNITAGKQGEAGYTFTLSLPWPALDTAPQMQLAQMEAGQ